METERKPESDKERYVIGLEIDKLRIKGSLVDSRLKPLESLEFSADNVKSVGVKCADLVEELIKKSDIQHDKIYGIGMGAGEKSIPIAKNIENKFKIRTFYAEAAACAALGEIYLNPDAAAVGYILYVYSDLGACALLKSRNLEVLPQEVSSLMSL